MPPLSWPSHRSSTPRAAVLAGALLVAAALLLLPSSSFAGDHTAAGDDQTEQGGSSGTALTSAGRLARGSGYGVPGGSRPVRVLQLRLRRLGFEPGPIDGIFGPLTQGAVLRFQDAHGLVVDGIVGPLTKKPLLARRLNRPDGREASGKSEPAGHERAGHDRAASKPPEPDRPAAAVAPPPDAGPDGARASQAPVEPQSGSGPAAGLAAGLGALGMGLLLGGVWVLTSGRRSGQAGGARAERRPATGRRLQMGMVFAALLAVFAVGAAAGALFATHAADGERASGDDENAALVPAADRAGRR